MAGALLAALTLAACGGSDNGPITRGESEAVNVKAGELIYQVQLSRMLNPAASDDRQFLSGVAEPELADDEQWFGVWVRAQNVSDEPQQAAERFTIVDAEGNEYQPVELDETNPFQYRATVVDGKSGNGVPLLPEPESAAGSGPIQGAMLLFKLPYGIYENTPVELQITPAEGGDPSVIKLDL